MAGDLNRAMLVGRFTRDPELRQLNSGSTLCRFSIANNRIFSQNGEKREEVSFFNCTAWGRQAEIIQQYCHKGKQVAIEGRLRQNSWQDNEGKKHSNVEIVVEQLQLLGSSQARSGGGGGAFQQEVDSSIPSGENSGAEPFQPVAMGNPQAEMANRTYDEKGPAEDDDIPF